MVRGLFRQRRAGQDWLQKLIQKERTQAVGSHLEIVALFGVRSEQPERQE